MPARFTKGKVISIDPRRPSWRKIRRVAAAIRRGEVAATPTDTLYGLAADPFLPGVAQRIFTIKQRPESKPILLLIDSVEQLHRLARELPPFFPRLAAAFWPGPLTVILRAADKVPEAITAGTGTVAVRWPAAALVRALVRAAGSPLTGTSANLSGMPPATTAAEVKRQLGEKIYYIVDGGRSYHQQPSTILDLTSEPRIVRQGAIRWSQLREYLAKP